MSKFKYTALSVALINVGISMPTLAQVEQKTRLEEVIVTATKRETSLNDTPLAISAFNKETLDDNHIGSLFDMRGLAPGFEFQTDETQASHVIYIRGVGSNNSTEFGDPAAAFYIDGIFAGRPQGSLAMMYDLDRVEVLRGPQGTLFGRNSTAGAVAVHTAKPTQELESSASLTLGNYDKQAYEVTLNVPLTDKWAVRIASASDNRDGWIDYSTQGASFTNINGQKSGAVDMSSTRLSSLYNGDSVDWLLSYERFDNNSIPTTVLTEDQYEERSGQSRQYIIGTPSYLDLNADSLRTGVDWELNESLTLSYIGGYNTIDKKQSNFTGIPLDTPLWDYESMQHELQLKNSDDARFRWTTGLYRFEEELDNRFDILLGGDATWDGVPVAPGGEFISYSFAQNVENEAFSAYAQGTYDVSDKFRLTAGLRFTDEEKANNGGKALRCNAPSANFALPGQFFASPGSVPGALGVGQCYVANYNDMKGEWDEPTYLLRGEYDLNDDVLLFATYSTGFKSGILRDGKGADANNNPPSLASNNELLVEPEFVNSFELGAKATLLDGSMQLNANLFFMDYEDLQVTTVEFAVPGDITSASTLVTNNAAESEIKGLELEIDWAPTDVDHLELAATVLDATYTKFIGPSTVIGNGPNAALLNTCLGTVTENGACSINAFDFSGNNLPFASDFTLAAAYSHDFKISSGAEITPRLKVYYNSGFFSSPDNIGDRPAGTLSLTDSGGSEVDEQGAYTKIDASVTYSSPSDQWSVEAFATNLTDEAIKNRFDDTGTPKFVYQAPKMYGVRLKYDW